MDDFEDSFDNLVDESDAFTPEKPVKKAPAKKAATAKPTTKKATTAPKKTTAPKSDKPKAPAKPRAKKPKIVEDVDVDNSFEMDRTLDLDVLATPQGSSQNASPARPSVLQENNAGGSKKNASETYQKVCLFKIMLILAYAT
jgi:hypothetical protein